ncbi:MAG TPA: CDP-diacylglycerol--serine O-phosphatidyltransferase [Arenimonas sp.]|uniref:CDP-diacylglycerol--serine O-phosphatidyltransferase n=1 Tax=Arenimonas sp. TaxID=1872635 RepID=UPI002C4E40A5|nr:CDP-diacylglycerol--serine O-phosphatidyltransferase [Arenimonas sp.]HMB57972.1 CDP-diacylglycerol--serine O-phosphatidyltransferase [Arenimonas sp.]
MEAKPEAPRPRNRHIYLLPNLLTTCGLFSGFYAILAAANGQFVPACVAVFVAALFDGVDGRVARLTGTSSEFGVQFDSLADLVSFGVAPALVMYHWGLESMKLDSVIAGKLGWAAAFLYVACAALRLARFNTQVGVVDKRWFIGLNSPSSAGLMMSFVWSMTVFGYTGDTLRYAATALTICCGLLMVSRIRYTSFKGGAKPEAEAAAQPVDSKSERVPFWVMLLVVGVLVALMIDAPRVLLTITAAYALSGPGYWLWHKLSRKPIA